MSFQILYIDDDDDQTIEPYIELLTNGTEIKIRKIKPTQFEVQMDEVIKEMSLTDGILIDLKLSGNQKGDRTAKYPGQVLAQAIRTWQTSEDTTYTKECPIFLITSQENFQKYYQSDSSSHDLFDAIIYKTQLNDKAEYYKNRVIKIIEAYKSFIRYNSLNEALGLDDETPLTDSLPQLLKYKFKSFPINELSKFVLDQIISTPGLLVNEKILAARLGVDITKSDDWPRVKELFKDAKYTGVFSDLKELWWSVKLVTIWKQISPSHTNLISLDTKEKIETLKLLGIDQISPSTPIKGCTSTSYWTVCEALSEPIDPIEGILVLDDYKDWQDKKYLSLYAIAERTHIKLKIEIDPSEESRIEELLKNFS